MINAIKTTKIKIGIGILGSNIVIFALITTYGTGLLTKSFSNVDTTLAAPMELNTKPYVRLFTQGNGSPGTVNASKADQLSQWFVHVHGEGSNPTSFTIKNTGLGSLLVNRNVWSSQYRNGSYSSQADGGQSNALFSEANDLEKNHPSALATFWPGDYGGSVSSNAAKLQSNWSSTDTELVVPLNPGRPTATNQYWPYMNSNDGNSDGYSNSTADYISWLRIDNEIVKVIAPPNVEGANVRLTVQRGIWGTTAANHNLGAKVLSPVYLGVSEYDGTPLRNDPNSALRYVYQFWKPDGYQWLADRILQTLGDGKTVAQGGRMVQYDTVWLDVSSCDQYNIASAYKTDIDVWDDLNDQRMTRDNWGKYQTWKLNGQNNLGGGLRDLVKMADGSSVKFTANSMLKTSDFNNGINNTVLSCTEKLLAETLDAGSLEGWLKQNFAETMQQSFEIQQRDWPAMYWVRYDAAYGGAVPYGRPEAHKRFTYGSYLLSYNPNATKPQFGMTWGYSKPQDLFFYNFGTPASKTTSLADVEIAPNVYKRVFSNGIIYVNAGSTNASVTIPTNNTYYQVSGSDELSVDLAPTVIAGLQTIQPSDALFIIKDSAIGAQNADINSDGTVNIFDLSILISRWNTNDTSADINIDNLVDISDLSILISKWSV